MYLTHWGLTFRPFRNTPDTRFFYHSATHDGALAELLYATEQPRGAAVLTGPFGSGKTLLVKALMAGLPADRFIVGRVGNALMRPAEVVLSCARALGAEDLPADSSAVSDSFAQGRLDDRLEAIAAGGRQAVLAIDDAHVITERSVWEALRLVMAAQVGERDVLTLILSGHESLLAAFGSVPGFAERLAVRTSLVPLTREEALEYILHRLARAGSARGIFTGRAAAEIARLSGGIPAKINRLADLCLAAAFGAGQTVVGPAVVRMVAESEAIGGTGGSGE